MSLRDLYVKNNEKFKNTIDAKAILLSSSIPYLKSHYLTLNISQIKNIGIVASIIGMEMISTIILLKT